MKVVFTLFFNYSIVICSLGQDTLWQVANKVFINAPKNSKVTTEYDLGTNYSIYGAPSQKFYYNEIEYEDSLAYYEMTCVYNSHTHRYNEKQLAIEACDTLSEIAKTNLIVDKTLKADDNVYFHKNWGREDWCFQPPFKALDKYYGVDLEELRRIKRSIYTKRKIKKVQLYEGIFRRSILIDTVIYSFTLIVKKRPRSKYRARQILCRSVPLFKHFVGKIIIREEEE